jgi:hypothetical protein
MNSNIYIHQNDINMAFNKHQENLLRKIHLYLNHNYCKLIFNQDEELALSESEISQFKNIENVWIEHEKSECFNKYDCYKPIKDVADVEEVLRQHSVYKHEIFNYFSQYASLEDIKYFIGSDSVLNMEFFDYLAYAVIGASDQTRLEIMSNMWDEAGKGSIELFHTVKFKKLMTDLGLKYNREIAIQNMTWEGLAGINLFSYMSLYSVNKMKYFGALAATEMLDPPHYHQLLNGLSRAVINKKVDAGYYIEHETIDVLHASGWMNNVVLPILRQKPDKIPEFWLGFYLRLDSVQRYYDKLLKFFENKKAA